MSKENDNQNQGILAFVTTDKDRYLGGRPLALLAKDEEELLGLATTVAKAFLADIVQFPTGDYMVIKK